MTEQETRQVVEKYIQCISDQNLEDLADLLHEDYVEEFPQSGERIKGKENWRKVYEAFPNMPEIKGYNLHVAGDIAVLEMLLDYPDSGIALACDILVFEDGKIARNTGYFGQPFAAPEWRSKWVEMMGEPERRETFENLRA